MLGGAVDLGNPYTFVAIETLSPEDANKWMAKTKNSGETTIDEAPDVAVLLVSEVDLKGLSIKKEYSTLHEIATASPSILTKVKGISWYTTAKIIEELNTESATTASATTASATTASATIQAFSKQLFEIRSDPTKEKIPYNTAKSIIIALVHGIHGFATAKKVENVPDFSVGAKDKLIWVQQYINSLKENRAEQETIIKHIEGLMHYVMNQYIVDIQPKKLDTLLNIFKDPIYFIKNLQ